MTDTSEQQISKKYLFNTRLTGEFLAHSNANELETKKVLSKYGNSVQSVVENNLDGVDDLTSRLINMKYYRSQERSLVAFDFGTDSDRFPKITAILERTGKNTDNLGPIIQEYYLVYGDINLDNLRRIITSLFIRNDFVGEPVEVNLEKGSCEELETVLNLSEELDNLLNI